MSQHKVRATSSFDLICVSSHSSCHRCKSQDLPALELLKHCDLPWPLFKFRQFCCIILIVFALVWPEQPLQGPSPFSKVITGCGRYPARILNE